MISPEERSTIRERSMYLLINGLVFHILYLSSNYYGSTLNSVESVYFSWEKDIPFIQWTIIPYLSSWIVFSLQFLLEERKAMLFLLHKRVLFITISSTVCFFVFPLSNAFTIPNLSNDTFRILFETLHSVDKPFNQCPSLHVSYTICAWFVFRDKVKGVGKVALALWFIAICLSTVTTFQHHCIDIVGAIILICITLCIFPEPDEQLKKRHIQIGGVYVCIAMVLLTVYFFTEIWYLLYCSISLFIVACVYFTQSHIFINKRSRIWTLVSVVIFSPYLFCYWFMWKVFKTTKPYGAVTTDILFGRTLTNKEFFNLSKKTTFYVIDLSSELLKNKNISNERYFPFPQLDLIMPSHSDLQKICDILKNIKNKKKKDEKIYVQCTMGFARSAIVIYYYLTQLEKYSHDEALLLITDTRPEVVLSKRWIDLKN